MKRQLRRCEPLIVLREGDEGILMNGVIVDPLYFREGFDRLRRWLEELPGADIYQVEIPVDFEPLVDLLLSAGILTDGKSEFRFSQDPPDAPSTYRETTLFLLVAQACNQRCVYCFAESGKFNSDHPAIMDEETALRAVEFALKRTDDGGTLNVAFFGGEPLLNWKLVQMIPDMINRMSDPIERSIDVTYSMSSNLVRFPDGFTRFGSDYNLGALVNIDGLREHHALQRPLASGGNSYDQSMTHAAYCIENGIPISIRTTVTSRNLDHLLTIARRHRILGAQELVLIPVIPLTAAGTPLDSSWYPDPMGYVQSCIEIAQRQIWEIDQFSPLKEAYYRVPDRLVDRFPCGVSSNAYLVVDTSGEVYPCPYLVGDMRYRMGSIFSDNPYDLRNDLSGKVDVDLRQDCLACSWRYLCVGHCPLNVLMPRGGEPDSLLEYWRCISCEVPRYFLEWSLWDICRKGFQAVGRFDSTSDTPNFRKNPVHC